MRLSVFALGGIAIQLVLLCPRFVLCTLIQVATFCVQRFALNMMAPRQTLTDRIVSL